jgi:hypothetical protein
VDPNIVFAVDLVKLSKKTNDQIYMKKLGLMMFLVGCVTVGVFAQPGDKKDNAPIWISKDVQRLQFRATRYTPAVVTTGTAASVVSKGVAAANARRTARPAVRVVTGGTPSWVVSKGVARMQAERQ